MSSSPPAPDVINRLFDAVYPSFAMLAGLELDWFTILHEEPRSAKQLADALDVKEVKLSPLLYVLVVAKLLSVEDDLFSNTPEASHYLVRDKPTYRGGMRDLTSSNWTRILATATTSRAGRTSNNFDYHSTSRDDLIALYRGLNPGAIEDARRLMKHYDWTHYRTPADIGGGSGALAITIAQAKPYLISTVIDPLLVTRITHDFIAEADMLDQVQIITADAIREPLSVLFDVIVARHFFQVLSENDCRTLMKNLASMTNPGGVILIGGWTLDNTRLTPEKTVAYNLILLNAHDDGQAYTVSKSINYGLPKQALGLLSMLCFLMGQVF